MEESNSNNNEKKEINWFKIFITIVVIAFIAGIFMIDDSTKKTEYSTEEYWVAKDFHHVYEKYSGQIVDYIEKNETCKIEGKTITVIKTNHALNTAGWIITVFAGLSILTIIYEEWKEKHNRR